MKNPYNWKCRVCGSDKWDCQKIAYDFMTEKPEENQHEYRQCADCGSLSAKDNLPENAYPSDYYSYKFVPGTTPRPHCVGRATKIIQENQLTEKSAILDWGGGGLEQITAFYKNGVGEDKQLHKLRVCVWN